MNIATLIKNNTVRFNRYRAGQFYNRIVNPETSHDMEFPVPLEDIGDATLPDVDKAIMFMRYIRKAIADNTFSEVDLED